LEDAAKLGSVIVCDLVYAELFTYSSSQRECYASFSAGMRFEPDVADLSQAGRPEDADSGGLPDWGACTNSGAAAAGADRGFYRRLFPSLGKSVESGMIELQSGGGSALLFGIGLERLGYSAHCVSYWAASQTGYTEPRRATMTIAIEVKPEVQAELAAQAAARGMEVPAYAAAVLEEAAHVPGGEPHRLSPEQLERTLDEMAQFSQHIPALPDEALSRESLYQDHD
jgi:hypothetical protein